jgi:acyl dehydratase
LFASGFQRLALRFRLFIQSGILAQSSLDSPSLDELHWLSPERSGNTLRSEAEVIEIRPSVSKPGRSITLQKISSNKSTRRIGARFHYQSPVIATARVKSDAAATGRPFRQPK